jgi:benzoate-CoA ligase family protein
VYPFASTFAPSLSIRPAALPVPPPYPGSRRFLACYTPPDCARRYAAVAIAPPIASRRTRQETATVTLPATFNVATWFVDRNVHEGRAAKTAIECADQRITYGQLLENTNRAGNALLDLGVRPEERVLLILLDTPDFLYCFFGAIKIGAVAVPVNTLAKPQDYEYMLNDSRARTVIVSAPLLPLLEAIPGEKLRYLRQIVVASDFMEGLSLQHPSARSASENVAARTDSTAPFPVRSLKSLMESSSSNLEPAATCKDEPAFWLYSSGSTGPSKGCVHLHHDMVVCSEAYAKGVLQMNESDRCFSVARLFFAYGLGNAGYYPLSCGATTILDPIRPAPANVYANIERYRPTLFFSVPTNFAALLAHCRENGPDFDLSSVRYAVSAGEALPAALFHRFKERFGVEILDALGSTETLHMVIACGPGNVKAGSSGRVIPGFAARLVNEEGQEVATNEIGDLLVKSDATCAGYWNKHDRSKDTFVGEWFRTGDKYWCDEDGYFWYAGRANDLFKVNGLWLSPAEVESILISHSAVREAAVVGREDHDGLIKPAAYVVLAPEMAGRQPDHLEALAQELRELVGQKIGGYKRPRWIEFVAEIPKTATGKLQRFKLRERQADESASEASKSEADWQAPESQAKHAR